MKVYVVCLSIDYEGETAIGVYTTLEKAIAEGKTATDGHDIYVYEYDLDGPLVEKWWAIPLAAEVDRASAHVPDSREER